MLVIIADLSGNPYRVLLLLHVLSSIAGFGGVLFNGLYAAKAARLGGPEGRAVSEANYSVASIAEICILVVPVSGIALMWASEGAWDLADRWVWLSLVLYAIAFFVSHAVLMPGHRAINQLLAEMETHPADAGPPPQLREVERLGRIQAVAGASLDVMLVVILVLMIWKPTA